MAFWLDSLLLEFVLVIVVLLTLFVLYSKHVYNHWSSNNIPELLEPPKLIFGNSKEAILKRISSGDHMKMVYDDFKRRNIPYGGMYFTLKPELIVLDPEMIKDIMVRDFQHFTDRGTFSDPKNDPLTGHLFSLGGQRWRDLRIKLTPTFTSGKMKMMFHTLVSCSDELHNILEEKEKVGEPLDIKEYLARFTTDVIGSCAFGIDCNCLKNPNADFRKYGQMFFERRNLKDILRGLGSLVIPDVYRFLKIRGMNPEISDFFMNVVKENVKYREEKNIYRKDFMQLLLQLKNEGKVKSTNLTDDELTDGEGTNEVNEDTSKMNGTSDKKKGITIEEIAAQCFVFFLAGFETSSTTMTFCLYELVKNPKIQEKLREEIVTVLKKHNGKLTYDAIMEMHYMDKVIYEALRKYPPVPFLFRKCTKDYKLPNSNYVLRKGRGIRIPILGIQRDEEYYPNPEAFDPERFSPEEKAKRHPFTWLPFGEGPRICIGLRFGMMQTKVGLTVLLKNYRLTLSPKTKEPVFMDPSSFIMSTQGGIWLDLHKV